MRKRVFVLNFKLLRIALSPRYPASRRVRRCLPNPFRFSFSLLPWGRPGPGGLSPVPSAQRLPRCVCESVCVRGEWGGDFALANSQPLLCSEIMGRRLSASVPGRGACWTPGWTDPSPRGGSRARPAGGERRAKTTPAPRLGAIRK